MVGLLSSWGFSPREWTSTFSGTILTIAFNVTKVFFWQWSKIMLAIGLPMKLIVANMEIGVMKISKPNKLINFCLKYLNYKQECTMMDFPLKFDLYWPFNKHCVLFIQQPEFSSFAAKPSTESYSYPSYITMMIFLLLWLGCASEKSASQQAAALYLSWKWAQRY